MAILQTKLISFLVPENFIRASAHITEFKSGLDYWGEFRVIHIIWFTICLFVINCREQLRLPWQVTRPLRCNHFKQRESPFVPGAWVIVFFENFIPLTIRDFLSHTVDLFLFGLFHVENLIRTTRSEMFGRSRRRVIEQNFFCTFKWFLIMILLPLHGRTS